MSDRAADKFIAFNNSLFAHQPAEGGEGLTDDAIASLARDAGVPAEVTDAFGDRTLCRGSRTARRRRSRAACRARRR
ncbi:hypothetical protein ACFQX7_17755 [Luedemannella flava]